MSKEMSGTLESTLGYIHGNNESVAMVNDILAQLRSMAQTQETVSIEAMQQLVSDAFLKHTGTGQAMRRVAGANDEQ